MGPFTDGETEASTGQRAVPPITDQSPGSTPPPEGQLPEPRLGMALAGDSPLLLLFLAGTFQGGGGSIQSQEGKAFLGLRRSLRNLLSNLSCFLT